MASPSSSPRPSLDSVRPASHTAPSTDRYPPPNTEDQLSDSSLSHPDFIYPQIQPFFTLIEDISTGTHHHPPEVHYIFSDEDSDALIEATQRIQHLQATAAEPASESNQQHAVRERYLVVELSGDGKSVAAARSLTSDWQILHAGVSKAPMMLEAGDGGDDAGAEGGQRRLMLRVEGIGEIGEIGGGGRDGLMNGDVERRELDIEDEVREFAARMADLRKIVEMGERHVGSCLAWSRHDLGYD